MSRIECELCAKQFRTDTGLRWHQQHSDCQRADADTQSTDHDPADDPFVRRVSQDKLQIGFAFDAYIALLDSGMPRLDHDWALAEANPEVPIATLISEGTHQDSGAFVNALSRYVRVADDGTKRVGWVFERAVEPDSSELQ